MQKKKRETSHNNIHYRTTINSQQEFSHCNTIRTQHNKKNNYFKTTMANQSSTQCPWKNFYTNSLNYMDSLHVKTCQPQIKIAKFLVAARHHFTSPMMNLQGNKKSKEQLKKMMENPNKSIKMDTADNRQPHQKKKLSARIGVPLLTPVNVTPLQAAA